MTAELPVTQHVFAESNFIRVPAHSRAWRRLRALVAVLTALAVVSCGGGGGGEATDGGGDPPAPPAPPAPTAQLTVTITGEGEVMASAQSLMCDDSCVFEVDKGSDVSLTAVPAPGFDFNLWQGDCSAAGTEPTCTIPVDDNKNVFAGFKQRTSGNSAPQAAISGDQAGDVNTALVLSGSDSSDPDGDPLSYQWSIVSTPAGASAVLGSPTDTRTTFEGDTPGIYLVSLVVNDGELSSEPATVLIGLSAVAPASVAGTISVSPGNFDPGAVLSVTVADADLNVDSASIQSVTVTAINQATDESELLTLIETAVDSGRFEGTIATASGSAGADNNGQLLVQDGDLVRLEYQDTAPVGVAITRAYVGDLALIADAPTMGLTNKSGVGTAVTFGVVFAPDQFLPNERPMISIGPDSFDGQINIMTRYPNGAPQHVLFSHHAPALAPGDNEPINFFHDFNPLPAETLSLIDLPAGFATGTAVEVIDSGTDYGVTVAQAAQVSVVEHFNGPVAAEWVLRAPLSDASGAEHPWLTARFYVRLYSNGETATLPVLQNIKAFRDNPARQINLDSVTFRIAGQIRHAELDVAIGHHSLGTPDEIYWWSATDGAYSQSMYVLHDYPYMRDRAKLFPYINPARTYSDMWYERSLNETRNGYGLQGIGLLNPNMPSSSWRGLVGPLPKTNLAWLTTQQPNAGQSQREQAYEIMLANALKMGSYHVQVEDESTNEPISIESYPTADLFGSVVKRPSGSSWINDHPIADTAHQPVIHAVPYLTTGWSHFLRQAKVWQTFNWLYRPNGSTRRPDPSRPEIWSEQQLRAQAWITYGLMDLLRMMPDDDPDRSYWQTRFDNGIEWYYENYVTPGTQRSPLGFFTMLFPHNSRIQSYMADFLAAALNHVSVVSETTGLGNVTHLKAIRDYGLSGTVNRLMHPDTVPEIWAIDYWWLRDTTVEGNGGYNAPILQTMEEVLEATFRLRVDNPARFHPFPALHPRGGMVPGGAFRSQERIDEINARIAAWHCSPTDPTNCLDARYRPGDQLSYRWPPGNFAPDSDPTQFPTGRFVGGYEGWKAYPHYCQAAVAAASENALPNGPGAWARYQGFGNPWPFDEEQYQFDVLPRP